MREWNAPRPAPGYGDFDMNATTFRAHAAVEALARVGVAPGRGAARL